MPPVHISPSAAARIAGHLKNADLPAASFVYSRATPYFPPAGAAWALPFFFVAVPHLYGLWNEDGRTFTSPICGFVDGREFHGEDFLWRVASRAAQEQPQFLTASFQAELTRDKLAALFRDDAGECPVPLFESHVEIARGYGQAMQEKNLSPNKIVAACRAAERPAEALVAALADIPGYREDPYRRKAFLLALILAARPEGFLPSTGDMPPLLDRHHLRLALRWGLLEVSDSEAETALREGITVPPPLEQGVRDTAYQAFQDLLGKAGRTVNETYGLFHDGRLYCPEDTRPDCPSCFFYQVCDKRIELKPPVVRTLSY